MRGQNAMDTLNVRTTRWVTKVPWHGGSAASCPQANRFVGGVSSCLFCQDRQGTIVSIDQSKFLPDVFSIFYNVRARSIQPKFAVQNQICGQPVVLFPGNLEIPGIFCSIGHTISPDAQPKFLTGFKNYTRFLNKFALISTHLVCVMWPNYPGTNVVGAAFLFLGSPPFL